MSDFEFPESDDLNDIITTKETKVSDKPVDLGRLPTSTHAKFEREVHGVNTANAFKETCPKCHGRGRFVSYSGRVVGECFACKGVGHKFFATSTEHRAATREKVAARKANKQQQALEAFQAAHPAVWAWIVESAPTFEFAAAMQDAIAKYGSLTEKQLAAAERCVEKRNAARVVRAEQDQARAASAPSVTSDRLLVAFQTAKESGLKWPKLRINGLVISPAPATGKNAGALYVKADGEYVGKVAGGRFICTRECSAEIQTQVVATINDPAAAAKASGLQTGSCSCCGRELTDANSVASGIGPICAEKWGW